MLFNNESSGARIPIESRGGKSASPTLAVRGYPLAPLLLYANPMRMLRLNFPILALSLSLAACAHSRPTADPAVAEKNGRLRELLPVADSVQTAQGVKIYFPTDALFARQHTGLRPEAQKNLIGLAELLAKYPHDALRISAGSDATQDPRLASERAIALRAYLTAKGVKNLVTTNSLAATGSATEIFVDFAPTQTTAANTSAP